MAVTLSKIADLNALESELRDSSPWMNVKVLYSHTVAEWIEQYESVQTWLQDQSVGPRSTVHTLQHEWMVWNPAARPDAKESTSSTMELARCSNESLHRGSGTQPTRISVQNKIDSVPKVSAAIAMRTKTAKNWNLTVNHTRP